jgi:multidrug efflux pump subunit AcrB
MLTGTLVTIAGFVPIGFAHSSAGEYTFSIFAVVAISLIVSWFVAVIFAPVIGMSILKAPKPRSGRAGGEARHRAARLYGPAAGGDAARWVTIALTVVVFVLSIAAIRFVPQQFFPASDRHELVVDLTLPQNASIHASEALAERFDRAWHRSRYRALEHLCRPRRHPLLPAAERAAANPFFAQTVSIAKDLPARDRLQVKLEKLLAEDFPSAVSRVYPLELGPPVGWPLQYRVSGPDIEQVREIAMRLAQTVATSAGARHVNFDWMEPSRQLRIRVDQDQARMLGLSSQAVATLLNAAVTGLPVTQVRDDIYLINVIARATPDQRMSLSTVRSCRWRCRTGGPCRSASWRPWNTSRNTR